MTKKNVLWIGVIGVGLFFIAMFPVNLGICEKSAYDCRKISDSMQMILSIFSLVFIFSLITYKMRQEVFQSWWRFARWFAPVIILVTFLINSQRQSGGMGISGAIRSSFNLFIIGIFYAIFIITSMIKIILTYRDKK